MIEHYRSWTLWIIGRLLKLLFSVNCQTTVAYRADHSLYFHHLWVPHTANYITPFHIWVRQTVRNVGPPHLGFSFPVGPPPSFLCNRSFQSYQNPDNFKSWHSCSYQSYQKPGTPCFSSTIGVVNVAFRATKILSAVGVDIPVDCTFQSYQYSDNFKSWRSLFHHLWVHHAGNYIISPPMWVRHTVRNVGPSHLVFSFLVGRPPSFLRNRSFQSY